MCEKMLSNALQCLQNELQKNLNLYVWQIELVTSEHRRTWNLVKHLRWSFFVKIVHDFKPLIIFTKSSILTRSWIRLCRSSHLRGVLENRCSEICSQNTWKIPMKKFIFSKFAGWQSGTFSCVPWGFCLIKKFVIIVFFAGFFLNGLALS